MTEVTYQHPAAAIQQAKSNFLYGADKPIRLSLKPREFCSYVKDELENRIAQFDCLTTASMQKNKLENDQMILKFQDNEKRNINICNRSRLPVQISRRNSL